MPSADPFDAARHVMTACNACGYCRGYCQVFNLSHHYASFTENDLSYLASLCYDCGACLDACQYAPPHAFEIDVPGSLKALRQHTYRIYARPRVVARFLGQSRYGGLILVLSVMLLSASFLLPAVSPRISSSGAVAPAFYDIVSWQTMVLIGGLPAMWSFVAAMGSVASFWRDIAADSVKRPNLALILGTLRDILTWRHFGALSHGCTGSARWRKYFHWSLFYGCMSCFASTLIATIYHHALGEIAPYPYLSLPVILGAVGGGAVVLGTIGMATTQDHTHPGIKTDQSLLPSLSLVAATGLLLLLLRESRSMTLLLTLHLGAVAGFFLSLPYGHFLHGPFRGIAMLRAAAENRLRAVPPASATVSSKSVSAD
ncbi:MAG: tricarballylate utilization 4Fe-4S protein TcuB [Proteobacteria bacterium]|nr:tricarballylate utilization 4Fe-4S protein TcuB [Pseudomonadota bacterium]